MLCKNGNFLSNNSLALIPIKSFLHRIFPSGYYDDKADLVVSERLFKPRKDCEPVSLVPPIDWEANNFNEDRNWRMQLQGWAGFHPIMNFFDDYPRKDMIVSYFLEIAQDWWGSYGDDPDDVVTTRMPVSYAWYDMSVGFRALVIAFFINRIEYFGIRLEHAERDQLYKLAKKHVANLSTEKAFSLNNHGLFQIQGLMSLLQVIEHDNSDSIMAYGLKKMEDLIDSQYDKSGIHLEHSPHYHFYATDTFEAIIASGWYDSRPELIKRVEHAINAKKWLVDPLKRPICIGDSILTEQTSVSFDLDSDADVVMSDFNSSGYCGVRSAWRTEANKASMLFMTGMYHSKAHKHRDCLSFDWFDQGARIICDSGKYGYRSDKYRNYFLSSRAHNSVEIEGFDIIKLKPYGSAIEHVKALGNDLFELCAGLDFPAIKHHRRLIFKPGRWLIVCDKLDFVRARSFTQWFHLEKDFKLVRMIENSLIFSRNNRGLLFIDCTHADVSIRLHKGDEDSMQGYICEKDYKYEAAYAVGFSGFGRDETVVTVLSLDSSAREEALLHAKKNINADVDLKKLSAGNVAAPVPIPGTKHQSAFSLDEIKFKKGKSTYRVYLEGVCFNFYANIKDSEKLIVMFPGATNRSKGSVDYQRFTWSNEFEESVICFSDPTINDSNSLSIGWFQNKEEAYGIERLHTLLQYVLDQLSIKQENLILFGSSAGGFVSLKCANLFPESPVVAINPQIYLFNYSKLHYQAMIDYVYSGMSHVEILNKYQDRLEVSNEFSSRRSPVFIFQNRYDVKHVQKHLSPYLKSIEPDLCKEYQVLDIYKGYSSLNIVYYEDELSGHSPPGKSDTLAMINSVLSSIKF
ncbi:alginate lyase family protein [Halomonas sp. CKK8]|uniref:alginate lyase family protein n=1 Tax=Halomonas sp. CKK8 TaxID=3036127 RepID=UPI0024157DCF|nr:alginate lyase family protein [Halomonas sp. CKK8]WFM69803.1 alginate lyase family protein [Halomonas sp. CKK8]